MAHWVPFTLWWNDHLPVDISFVFEGERPAGKHGFLTVQGDHFAFEDGAPGRFWGTNFNSGANFPSRADSEMVARRLAKFGLNLVRLHQMDAEWSTPNLFEVNRAVPKNSTRSLDPGSLDRLDYMIFCLKQQGIYIYLDLLTYRQFREGDGAAAYEQLPQAAKPYLYFDPHLIELQKEFNQQLWTHTNPYTGLAYKDDPCIVLTELVNEADFFTHKVTLEPYRSRFEALYRQWAAAAGVTLGPGPVDFTRPDPPMSRFFVEVMANYNREMASHLRGLGVKIPITGTNWTTTLGAAAAQQEMDFCDSHVYWNYPWSEPPGTVTSRPMVAELTNDYPFLAMMRLEGKPFFVSEWDHAYPAVYRAESVLPLAAVACLQNWGGAAIHTYRYGTWTPENRLAGASSAINGVVYRNFFDAFNDPAKFGLFYHAALIMRRGDVQPARGKAALVVEDRDDWRLKETADLPGLAGLPEIQQVGMVLPGQAVQSQQTLPAAQPHVTGADSEIVSDTSQLRRSWHDRLGLIDTPRSKAVYGFFSGKTVEMNGLIISVENDFGVVALSSLTDDPIERSPSILLTAIGRCENSHALYTPDRSRLLKAGDAPMLIEVVEATVKLRTDRPHMQVMVISEHGELARKLPTTYQDGVLSFEIGRQPEWVPSSMVYLLRG